MEQLPDITIKDEDFESFKRLDLFLSKHFPEHSRSYLQNLFKKDLVRIESQTGETISPEMKRMPPVGSIVKVTIPDPIPLEAIAENIPLEILYEDEHLLFVNKPAGMVTHPAPGNYTGTLVNALLYHCKDLKGIGDVKRPGIVHRLDKGTSGVMVVAKTQKCHEGLIQLFSKHDINRIYEACTLNPAIASEGTLRSLLTRDPKNRIKMCTHSIKGKKAVTHYKVLEYFEKLVHVQLKLGTGRTHQIRVHLSSLLNAPIVNDPVYASPKNHLKHLPPSFIPVFKEYEHPLLHAKTLGFKHPISGEYLEFETKLASPFFELIDHLKKEKQS